MSTSQEKQRESLNLQLKRTQRVLQILQEQKAGYGVSFPPELLVQIEEKEEEAKQLQYELEQLSLGMESGTTGESQGSQTFVINGPVGSIGNQGTIGNVAGNVAGNQTYGASQGTTQPSSRRASGRMSQQQQGREDFRIVIVSPSDVAAERQALAEEVIEELNRGEARRQGLRLEYTRWEDVPPGFHPDSVQSGIEEHLQIPDCDVVVCILWQRFGSPTRGDGRTGTEREFELAFEAWQRQGTPQILMYFSATPADLDKVDLEQLAKVRAFKKKIREDGRGLYKTYGDVADFKKQVREHLMETVLNIQTQRQH